MGKTFCLIGNPNSGKTTLFNAITGMHQKVGNWTGVTVEKKEGEYKKDKSIKIVDLPGVYSLSASSPDEKVVEKYLKNEKFDCIINVVDGTNLERNLFLTYKLLEQNFNVVLAVNMCDILEKQGAILNEKTLQQILKIPVIKVSAIKGKGIKSLIECAEKNNERESIKVKEEDLYFEIENTVKKVIEVKPSKKRQDKIDDIITHEFFGLIFFFMVFTAVYFLALKLGSFFSGYISKYFDYTSNNIENYMLSRGITTWVSKLVSNGIVGAIGTVLSFLPQIIILFTLLTLMEECGYASRVALVFDKIFKSINLSGKSILPLIVSSGCTTTGLMATRVIESDNERRTTIFLSPFIPCSAKTALFGWFSANFFNGNPLIASSMYFIGIFAVIIGSKVLKKLKIIKGESGEFILEIPPYRVPSVKNVFFAVLEKVKDFMVKAGTVILGVSVLIWFISSFSFTGYTEIIEESILYKIGSFFKWIFIPLGFGTPECSVSVISGLLAKESVIESLSALSNGQNLFTSYSSAYAFMAFALLSPPCISAQITAKRELNDNKLFIKMLVFQFLTGYLTALIINLAGKFLALEINLIFSVIIVIISLVICFMCIRYALKSKCNYCKYKGKTKCKRQ